MIKCACQTASDKAESLFRIEGAPGLWQRGARGDLDLLEVISHRHPESPDVAFLCGPHSTRLCVAPNETDADAVASLLEGQYWTQDATRTVLAKAQLGSSAWIVCRDGRATVIGSARALTDGIWRGRLYDVIVHPAWRGRGVGSALLRLLLDHPAVRAVPHLTLGTLRPGFYRRAGFEPYRSPVFEMLKGLKGPP